MGVAKPQPMLKVEDIDRLALALIELTKEVWVLRDRQKILESALEDAGVLPPDAINAPVTDEGLTADLRAERQQLIQKILGALSESFDAK